MINIKTLAKKRTTQKNLRAFNENKFILFYQAHSIKSTEISQFTKSIKDIDSSIKLTHIPCARIAKLLFPWNSQELQYILQGPTWIITSNDIEHFIDLIKIKDEKLTLLAGISEGHIIPESILKKYTKIGNKPYNHIVKLHHSMNQILSTIRIKIAYDIIKTIKRANNGD